MTLALSTARSWPITVAEVLRVCVSRLFSRIGLRSPPMETELLTRWDAALSRRSAAWRALQAEKAAGWASTAVEQYWRAQDSYHDAHVDRKAKAMVPTTTKCNDTPQPQSTRR
mmetsp:Transcript_11027/g.23737  ORF Transcript_11027/g.23737 Transcript_11027/m.23737 type:complete len:113 (+) Transcript_11027:106-444(+)